MTFTICFQLRLHVVKFFLQTSCFETVFETSKKHVHNSESILDILTLESSLYPAGSISMNLDFKNSYVEILLNLNMCRSISFSEFILLYFFVKNQFFRGFFFVSFTTKGTSFNIFFKYLIIRSL